MASRVDQIGKVRSGARWSASARMGRRGTVAVMTAAGLVPLLIAIGVGVDMGRLAMAKSALQAAADQAALAGATVYQTSAASGTAQTVATAYFNKAVALQSAMLASPTVATAAAPGNFSASVLSNNVTVTATATLQMSFLGLAKITSLTVTATATAANPWINQTGTTWMQPVISSGFLGSSAGDWNSVWMYAVPMQNGSPNFGSYPPISQFYEIASNCSAATSSAWQSNAQCNAWHGAVVPSSQTFPAIQANQPLAFVMFNMTAGQSPASSGGYTNQYGSKSGDMRLFPTAMPYFGAGPAALNDTPNAYTPQPSSGPATNGPDYWIGVMFGYGAPNSTSRVDATSHYSDVNNSSTPNCSLLIQVVDPAHPPTLPPLPSGSCYSLSDSRAGLQYANLTCAQMAGRTFIYWWNDMGGNPDDKDYNDMWFEVSCVPSPNNTNNGYLYSGNAPPPNLSTALIK